MTVETKEYINIQSKEKLDMEIVNALKDNAMLKQFPEFWALWDFSKNNNINIYNVTIGAKTKPWWYCNKCKDSYPQTIESKRRGSGCSICTGKYVTSVNCVATTNPTTHSFMLNHEDGYRYTQYSDARVDFKCPDCDNIIKNKQIKRVSQDGIKCPLCSDGFKYPEKLMSHILKQLKVEFSHDISLPFLKNRRYDFYLPEYNLIIETHGGQHFENECGFSRMGGRTLKEEQANDKYKYEIAMENGVDKYIVIDCRHSEIEWIRNSIENSMMARIFNLEPVNWDEADMKSHHSLKLECLKMFLNGRRDYPKMAEELVVDYATVMRWLQFWHEQGKCEYVPLDTRKRIIQLDMNKNFVKEWESVASVRIHFKNASKVLKNERSNDQGYRFMYKEDYELFLVDESSYQFYENKPITRQVVQLSMNDEFIKIWDTIKDASESLGMKNQSTISGVCRKRKISTAGFKWMYLDEYEEILKRVV